MNRSLVVAIGLALAAAVTLSHGALAQSPFPPPPQQSTFPPPPQQSTFPAAPQQSVFPSGPMQGGPPMGGPPPLSGQCASFPRLRDEAKAKADAVSAVGKRKGDRKEMCAAVQSFTAAEDKVVKFLEDNKRGCGVPDQAVAQAKAMHVNTVKFRDTVCAEGPKPKAPTLSDAVSSTPLDSSANTRTGRGTLDTLTGNPLAEMSGGSVADATGNWVDTLAPAWLKPYLRLARLDRPIGSWLLLLPCWWSSALAAVAAQARAPNILHLVLFFVGAFAMRGAGCTWNDIVDRDLDGAVERTRSRPIPSGQVSVAQAALFLVLQALIGFAVLITFNGFTVALGIASLAVVAIYPFMKRITYWPQIVLGLAFSWGALMGWAGAFGRLDAAPLLLYAGSISWVIGYDTIYAHQDREDDALIGIKSTALLFGPRTKPMLALFYGLAVILIGLAGFFAGAGLVFALGLIAFAAHLVWQIVRLDIADPDNCLKVFKSDRDAGLILFAGLVLDAALRRLS